MGTIFNALNIGYSGLQSSQIAIDTTGHNIANAQNPDYSRQRTVIAPRTPLNTIPGDVGLGAKISQIVRIHDEFVFRRLKSSSSDHEFYQLKKDTMDEISGYFPEIKKNGIYNGMQEFFNAWNDFSKNSDDSALKINLAQVTRTFTATIQQTRDQVDRVQKALDERLKATVDEINRIGAQIAEVNKRIDRNEAGGNHANDLRDQRDKLELTLAKLVNIAVSKGDIVQDTTIDRRSSETKGDAYHLNIGGSSFVDGGTFHPLVFKYQKGEALGHIYYRRQDYVEFKIDEFIRDGKAGALLSLRDGDIQKIIDDLDSFANGLIVHSNNLYANHATTSMVGNKTIGATDLIANSGIPIDTQGSFYVKVYDIDGNEVARRKITLSDQATFEDVAKAISASTTADINNVTVNDNNDLDDNQDNVAHNDVDDYVQAVAGSYFQINIKSDKLSEGYTFAIEEVDADQPTRFAGELGLGRFFDGSDAHNITLQKDLDDEPTKIGGNAAPVAGDNSVANQMVELQYQKISFYKPSGSDSFYRMDSLDGFFKASVTDVASVTASIHESEEASGALLQAVINEFDSISKVDIDEELTNLMKFQTGYSASAKVITTVDQMIQTLLGMKQ